MSLEECGDCHCRARLLLYAETHSLHCLHTRCSSAHTAQHSRCLAVGRHGGEWQQCIECQELCYNLQLEEGCHWSRDVAMHVLRNQPISTPSNYAHSTSPINTPSNYAHSTFPFHSILLSLFPYFLSVSLLAIEKQACSLIERLKLIHKK